MSEKSIWGPIISSDDIDEDDPVLKLKERIRTITDAPLDLSGNKTIKEAEEEKQALIDKLYDDMQKIFYKRKLLRLMA